MNTLRNRILRKLKPSYLLAVLFLLGISCVELGALPSLFYNVGNAVYWETGYAHLISTVDEQYKTMFTTEKEQPLLHNKATYIDFNGLMAHLLGQPMMNDRVMLKNGHLTHLVTDAPDPEELRSAAHNIIRFRQYHAETGGDFLFVMAPTQISKYEDLLPTGYTDVSNEAGDAFLALLEEAGVPCLDLRSELHADGISVTESHYTTDHHWKPEGGFWAYTKILEKLQKMGAINPVDSFYTDPENFRFVTHPDSFLGSSGKRTGRYFAGLDDSTLIHPAFDTAISVSVPSRQLELQGRYEDVAYNNEAVHNFADPDFYQENVYGLYGWGDTPLTHWRNENAPQQGRFLLIGDSFGNIPFSLMPLCLSSCDEMDMRYYEGDFAQYYAEYAPDTVIFTVNPDMVISPFTTCPGYPG